MDNSYKAHDPSTWQLDALFAWLSVKVPDVRTRISRGGATPPKHSELVSSILQHAKDHPDLCTQGHVALLDKVVATFVPKRIAPTSIAVDVPANPLFTTEHTIDVEADSDISSELSFDLEIWNPYLDHSQGFGPEQACRKFHREFRQIWRKYHLHRGQESVLVDEDDELMPEEDHLSELSSNFWKELEEDEIVEQQIKPVLDYAAIVHDEIEQLRQLWILRKLPKCQQKTSKLWSSYNTNSQRMTAAAIKLSAAEHLQSRLNKLQSAIIDSAGDMKETVVRRQCGSLEQTVFDHQRLMFEYSALKSLQPPAYPELKKSRLDKPSHNNVSADSDPDAISLDSGSASEARASIVSLSEVSHAAAQGEDIAGDEDIFISTDEEFLEEIRAMTDDTASDSESDITIEINDAVAEDSTDDNTALHTEVADPENSSDDIDKENNSLEDILNLTPAGKKRRKVFKQSQESKRHQSDAIRRALEDEQRAVQNLQTIMPRGQIAINPGKQEDEAFVYINEAFCKVLKPHQIDGARFLWRELLLEMDDDKATGCLLSHTMGLGKTLQIITVLVTIIEASISSHESSTLVPLSLRKSRTLILCPPGLVSNWRAEFDRWLPSTTRSVLCQILFMDPSSRRESVLESWAEHGGILVLGYAIFSQIVHSPTTDSRQQQATRLLLNSATLVVADEAHYIKNVETDVRKAVDQLTTKRRIAMTGSPLSNNIGEYWSLIEWVAPSYLGPSKEFRTMFEVPIQDGSYLESTKLEQKAARIALTTLEKILQPKVHRRDATILKDMLPPKREFILKLSLTPAQRELYSRYVSILRSGANSKLRMGEVLSRGKYLIYIANHPAVFSRHVLSSQSSKAAARIYPSDSSLNQTETERLALHYNLEDLSLSSKTICFLAIVNSAIAKKEKTLVFSQSLRTLDYLGEQLDARGISFDKVTGETKISVRSQLLANFNGDTGNMVLLISTRTGNAGFNIHGANRVIIFDFDWNPTYEEQAIGRAYRLGQQKNVFVYRFVSDGTFESTLLNTTAGKTQLSVQVVEGKRTESLLSKDPRRYIKAPEQPRSMSLQTMAQWIGQDDILNDIISLSHSSEVRFIADVIDAEVFRREREPEPLDDDQKRHIEDWVARFQSGEVYGPSTAQRFLQQSQMNELMSVRNAGILPPVAHDARTDKSMRSLQHTGITLLPLDSITQVDRGNKSTMLRPTATAENSERNTAQHIRSNSPDSGASESERQDVRKIPLFNNQVSTGPSHSREASFFGTSVSSGSSNIPHDIEVIDLTEGPSESHATSLDPSRYTEAASTSEAPQTPHRDPAQRAARALQQGSRYHTSSSPLQRTVEKHGSDGSMVPNLIIKPYLAGTSDALDTQSPPTWSNRAPFEARLQESTSTATQSVNPVVRSRMSLNQALHRSGVIGSNSQPQRRQDTAPAMTSTGVPQLTSPSSRRKHRSSLKSSTDKTMVKERRREDSPEAPDGFEIPFLSQMFPDLPR